jgi:hypothetical protein
MHTAGDTPQGASIGGVPLTMSGMLGAPGAVFEALPVEEGDPHAHALWTTALTACADALLGTAPTLVWEEQTLWPLRVSVGVEGEERGPLLASSTQVRRGCWSGHTLLSFCKRRFVWLLRRHPRVSC